MSPCERGDYLEALYRACANEWLLQGEPRQEGWSASWTGPLSRGFDPGRVNRILAAREYL